MRSMEGQPTDLPLNLSRPALHLSALRQPCMPALAPHPAPPRTHTHTILTCMAAWYRCCLLAWEGAAPARCAAQNARLLVPHRWISLCDRARGGCTCSMASCC